MDERTLHFERRFIMGEDGETILDVLRRTVEVVEELNSRPRGRVTDISFGEPEHRTADVTFRLETDEEVGF